MIKRLTLLLCCVASFGPVGGARAADLHLTFTPKTADGQLAVAVFSSAGAWRSAKTPQVSRIVPVGSDAPVSMTFDLPPGEYGVMAYHDRNANQALDRMLGGGPPTEPYGFSNNSRGMFGPPSWQKAKLVLPPGGAAQAIALR